MNRAHRSQVRELLLQLTDLKNRLNATFGDAGGDMSTHEEISIKKALAELNSTIKDLTEII